MKERDIQKQIIEYLTLKGWKIYRINNVGIYNRKTDSYFFRGTKGVSDILAVKKDKLAFIEVKQKGKKPTQEQAEFLELVDGVTSVRGFVARSIEDLGI